MLKLSELKEYNPIWFGKGNARFFGDEHYRILMGKRSKQPFLVRKTSGFSDMFTNKKKYFWAVNRINEDLKIGELVHSDYRFTGDNEFKELEDVKQYLKDM